MSKNTLISIVIFLVVAGSIVFVVTKKRQAQQSRISQTETQSEVTEKPETNEALSETSEKTSESPVTSIKEVSEITLSVTSPLSGTNTSASKITVMGKTSPKAEVFANEAEGNADSSGNFSLPVSLDEGENSIIVTAVDADGKVAEKEILVTYVISE